VLIDDEPEYLAITAEGTFRSRTRYQDASGEWVAEIEEIESGGELVEIYNPADLYAAFAEAAREEAGLPPEPTAAEDLLEVAGVPAEVGVGVGQDGGSEGPGFDFVGEPRDKAEAARMLYDLALTFQERSQRSEARILEQSGEKRLGTGRVPRADAAPGGWHRPRSPRTRAEADSRVAAPGRGGPRCRFPR